MFIEIFHKRILWNEVLFSAKNATIEFTFFDIATDGMNITVKDGSNLLCGIEVEFDGHLKRTPSIFSRMNTTLFDDAPDLIGGDINSSSDFDDILDDLVLPPVMECDNTYAEKLAEFLGSEDVVGFWSHLTRFSKGIPVSLEIRSMTFFPKSLLPVK